MGGRAPICEKSYAVDSADGNIGKRSFLEKYLN